jgi:hypothetical protein
LRARIVVGPPPLTFTIGLIMMKKKLDFKSVPKLLVSSKSVSTFTSSHIYYHINSGYRRPHLVASSWAAASSSDSCKFIVIKSWNSLYHRSRYLVVSSWVAASSWDSCKSIAIKSWNSRYRRRRRHLVASSWDIYKSIAIKSWTRLVFKFI